MAPTYPSSPGSLVVRLHVWYYPPSLCLWHQTPTPSSLCPRLPTKPLPHQINAAHWCAVRQIHGLSNTTHTHKEWWVRDSAWNGVKTHTHTHKHAHTHTHMLTSSWNRSLNLVPNDELFFFWLLCHLSPQLSLPSLSRSSHILDTSQSNGHFRSSAADPDSRKAVCSITPLFSQLAFFSLSLHPSINSHPLFNQGNLPFLFHPRTDSFRIIHIYVNNPSYPTHPCAPWGMITDWLRW